MRILSAIILAFLPILSIAQLSMGGWRTHFSYGSVSMVEQSSEKIFAVSEGSLFSINKDDGEINTYSKIGGLNDISIAKIKYSESLRLLVIAYTNGNIDLLSESGITNISDIKNKAITGNKSANDINIIENKAYISNGFGVILIDLIKKEVSDTYIFTNEQSNTGNYTPALGCIYLNDSIYILSKSNLYSSAKNSNFLANYQNWNAKNIKTTPSDNRLKLKLLLFKNKMYLLNDSGAVFSSEDAINWTIFNNSTAFKNIRVSDNNLLLYTSSSVYKYNENLELTSFSTKSCNDIVYTNNDQTYWAATDSSGVAKIQNNEIVNTYKIEGPINNKIFKIKYKNGRLYGYTSYPRFTEESELSTLFIKDDSKWINFSNNNIKPLINKDFRCVNHITIDPNDSKHYFISLWRDGIFEFKNDQLKTVYDETNTDNVIHSVISNARYLSLHAGCLDQNMNLWFNQDGVGTPINEIKVKTKKGEWFQYSYPGLTGNNIGFEQTIVTKNNFKWMNNNRGKGGIFILNDNNSPEDFSKHKYKYYMSALDQDDEIVSLSETYCMAEDKNDEVWIGTSSGIVVFKNIDEIFNSNYKISRIKIPRNDGTNYADYLLGEQKILDIAVDGSNRKWIATESAGVYLISSDGIKELKHFTNDNSPLLSNMVSSITINNKTGEVFFATNSGLMSYQSDATESNSNLDSIKVYPNPVRENFAGQITFTGLMENSIVKVSDKNGSLVYQTKSNGGIATWNGLDFTGKKASTGVYFVMSTNANENNTEDVSTGIGKFLIVK